MSKDLPKSAPPADPARVASKMVAKSEAEAENEIEAVEGELEDKTTQHEPVRMENGAPPMQVHADVEKTPARPDPEHPGYVSGGDIIIRLSQVELNQRLNKVGEQTERANEISTQIAEAFNALSDEYQAGWEVNQQEQKINREAILKSQESMRETQASLKEARDAVLSTQETLHELTKRISSHEDALDSMAEKTEHQIDRQIQHVAGSVTSMDETNIRQQTLLIRLVIVSILLSAVAIVLQFVL